MIKQTKTVEVKTPCGTIHLTQGQDFLNIKLGKNGNCEKAISGLVQDLIVEIIKLDPKDWKTRVLNAAKGHRCEEALPGKASCIDACYRALKDLT